MTPDAVARLWIEAFNRHDARGMVALYAEDAVHLSPKLRVARPETEGRIRGKAALLAWWEDAFSRLPGIRYELIRTDASEGRAFLEYLRHVEWSEPMRVMEVFDVHDGLIVRSAVYHG